MKGYIVDQTYETIDEKTIIKLFGKLENGQSFVTLNTLNPYFFIKEKDLGNVEKLLKKYKVEKTKLTNFEKDPVVKISAENSTEINKIVKAVHDKEVDTYEADVKPAMRFLIDKDILGTLNIEGDYESSEKLNRIYKEPEITPAELVPKLKVVAIDLESNKTSSQLFCIGIYGENYKKNFMITNKKLENTVSCKNEEDCLQKFKDEIIKIDPDIIAGWNVIDFDLKYLEGLFKKNKIPFDLGRSNDKVRIRIESDFFKSSSVDIPGRQVLDGLNLIKDPFIQEAPSIKNADFDTYTLEDVSQAILGEGKLIKGKERHDEIEEMYNSGTEKKLQLLVDYNLHDCKLAYDLIIKTKIIDLAIERSQLNGLPLDRLTASIAAFDSLYIREARKKGLVSPTTRFKTREERIKGGYVFSSNAGIYNGVVILDFKSLYPSVIRTFNIDPASFLNNKEKGAIESPNHAYFRNSEGILPIIIEKLHQAREKAKKEKRELASYAIKIIMNSFFGVLANPNCRYYSVDIGNSITQFAQFIIKLTGKEIENKGYKVIYQDTDSVFIETGLDKDKARKVGQELQEYVNNFYQDYIKKNYSRKSYLEIQFEELYLSMMIPKVRGKEEEVAAKKRYAGLVEINGKEEVEITGLEAIRGDWTDAAKEFQRELLLKAFKKEPLESFIKSYIKKIKEGKLDSKLIYRKSIRKSLDEYTKTTPPHVKAARKLESLDSNIIQYYITTDGPEPIQKLKHPLDYDHYIKKQIEPIANQILSLFDKNLEEVEKNAKQAKLF